MATYVTDFGLKRSALTLSSCSLASTQHRKPAPKSMPTNTYGFTIKTQSNTLLSWIVEAPSRRSAFDQLNQGDKPDTIVVLTCRLDESQRYAWIQACLEHGGFDDQIARSVLNVF